MPSLKDQVIKFFADLIPVKRVTVLDSRQIPSAIAHTVTVDRVHQIFRDAEAGNTESLFALYRDVILSHSHLQGRIADRKRAVLGDTISLQPFDKKQEADRAAVDACWPLTRHADWKDMCNHLLDAHLWPVAVVEKVYKGATMPGLRYELARLVPVPYELLDFQLGRMRIRDTDDKGHLLSTYHDPDPARYIVHRGHLLTTPDHWGGPMRSLIFWWLLATMDREWWARFLDRYGAPFVVGKYDQADDGSRTILERAFMYATKVHGLVVSRDSEVEIKQAAASDSGAAFDRFHQLCNEEISKLILGQTLSSDAKATGLGSGVASLQEGVRDDIRKFDAQSLGATITTQLAAQFLQINGLKGAAPIFVWGSMSPAEMKAYADFLSALKGGGLRLAAEGVEILSERFGLPLERDDSAAPAVPGLLPFGVRAFSAPGVVTSDEEVARTAAASLARTLGRHHAQVAQIIRTSRSPADAVAQVEAYCATFDPREAARIIEEVMIAYAANGSVAHAR